MIRKEGNKYALYSEDGEKKLGTFDTKEEAEDQDDNIQRLRQRSEIDMVITKASILKDGTMRFHATCSDTEEDSRGEHTTRGLFTDWMERVEKNKTTAFLPAPRIPFLSIAHYSSMEGLGEAGIIEKGYIDGNRFKVSGLFFNDEAHPCGPALFSAVQEQQDLVQKGKPVDDPIRISAAWWDLAHAHGDFVFERKSLTDICPMCEENKPRTFLQGQLDHFAATRVPINPRTSLELEELSENIRTRKADAASMIGEELAELLDNAYRSTEDKSEILVSLSDKVELAFGGATTFGEAEDAIAAQEIQEQVWTNLDIFMMIADNIMFISDTGADKVTLMKEAIDDFGARIAALKSEASDVMFLTSVAKGATMTTKEPIQKAEDEETGTSVLALQQAVKDAMADSSLDRDGKFAVIQPALEAFANDIKAQVDATTPPDMATELSKAFAPIGDKLDLLISKLGAAQVKPLQEPVQRSLAPGRTPEPVMPNKPLSIREMVRRSTGIVE
jgi:hypothetical protein